VKAEEYYRKALTFGETSSIYFNLGVACDKLNKKDEMEADLKKAIALDSSNHLALNYLGYSYLLADKNIKEALSLIEKANKLDPDNGAYIDSLGWAYYKLGKYNAAKKLLERAVQIEDDPEVMEHLGFLYYSIHDYTKAILWWSKSLERTGKKEIRDMIDKVRGTIQSTVP
jgi:tetratricopeptide (TPR) repeat protein